MTFRKRNGRKQIVLPPGVRSEAAVEDDSRSPLRVALARVYRWQKMIESDEVRSAGELARRFKLDRSFIARSMRLTALASDIVEAVLRGEEPDGLSLRSIRFEVPLGWQEQRDMLGMPVSDRLQHLPTVVVRRHGLTCRPHRCDHPNGTAIATHYKNVVYILCPQGAVEGENRLAILWDRPEQAGRIRVEARDLGLAVFGRNSVL